MEMLTPPVLVRRFPFALVAAAAGLTVSAGLLAARYVDPEIERPERARVVCPPIAPPSSSSGVGAQSSPRNFQIDLLSARAFRPDGLPDEVLDVDLISSLAVKAIFLRSHNGLEQWDTVAGGGARLGVRVNGAWITNPQTGALDQELPGGTHRLELIASGGIYGCGRSVTVMFVDGTTVTDVIPITRTASSGGPEDDECAGVGNAAVRPSR